MFKALSKIFEKRAMITAQKSFELSVTENLKMIEKFKATTNNKHELVVMFAFSQLNLSTSSNVGKDSNVIADSKKLARSQYMDMLGITDTDLKDFNRNYRLSDCTQPVSYF